jgi:flagellar biosynthesis/type III secretory pathway protein FliH
MTTTPEQRLDRLEHFLAGWVEQSKKEHAENREFIRESKRDMDDALRRFTDEGRAQMAAIRAEFAERDRAWHAEMAAWRAEVAARDIALDRRITDLVIAIGKLIERKPE